MVKVITAVICGFLILSASVASAQSFLGLQTKVQEGKNHTPGLYLLWTRGLDEKEKDGVFVWALATESWSEAYGGLSRYLMPWMQVYVGAGVETDDEIWRVGSVVWMGGKGASFLAILEDGGSGWWHRFTLAYTVTDVVGVGVLTERFTGTGPYVEFKVGKAKVWAMAALDQPKGLLGMNYGF